MASIGQLIRAVANSSGLDEASVKISARYLRQAGLIEQRSTGAGAARMTSADAAALLIAVNAAALLKDSVDAVRTFGALPLNYMSTSKVTQSSFATINQSFSKASSFGQALALAVETFKEETSLFASIEFLRPVHQAFIRLYVADNDFDDIGIDVVHSVYSPEIRRSSVETDRYVKTVFGHKTLKAVAAALND
jgi:hypothetical protein